MSFPPMDPTEFAPLCGRQRDPKFFKHNPPPTGKKRLLGPLGNPGMPRLLSFGGADPAATLSFFTFCIIAMAVPYFPPINRHALLEKGSLYLITVFNSCHPVLEGRGPAQILLPFSAGVLQGDFRAPANGWLWSSESLI